MENNQKRPTDTIFGRLPRIRQASLALMITMNFGFLAQSASAQALENSLLYDQAISSAAFLVASTPGVEGMSLGTGVVIDARRGLILTAYHVVKGQNTFVSFKPVRDNRHDVIPELNYYLKRAKEIALPCRLVAKDESLDLALLQTDRAWGDPIEAIPLAERSPAPGEKLITMGNSGVNEGVLWRFGDGSVRQVYQKQYTLSEDQKVDARIVEMTVPINPGDSGGPVLNGRGELVGINSAGDPKKSLILLAIDSKEFRGFLERVEENMDFKILEKGEKRTDASDFTFVVRADKGQGRVIQRQTITVDPQGQITASSITPVR